MTTLCKRAVVLFTALFSLFPILGFSQGGVTEGWNQVLGIWYGTNGTEVKMFMGGEAEHGIYITYGGRTYGFYLNGASDSFARAMYRLPSSGNPFINPSHPNRTSILSAEIYRRSNNEIYIELYEDDQDPAFYTSTLTRTKRVYNSNNELVGTTWLHVNRNNQLSCKLYFISNTEVQITNYLRFSALKNAPVDATEVLKNRYTYDQRTRRGIKYSKSGEPMDFTYSNGKLTFTGHYNDGTSATMIFTRE